MARAGTKTSELAARDGGYTPPSAIPEYLVRHMTLRQLQVFEAIVRLGSFTRAAEELFLTQPTVSTQIKKLADSAGLPLFEHIGRAVHPTEAGTELYAACRQMFSTLSNLEMKLADLKGLRRGRLRLGVITTAEYFTPEILGEFSRLYPGIDVSMKVTNRERVIERMHDNEDDLYVMGQAPAHDVEVETYNFAPNPLVVMAPRDHPLVGQKNISLARISEEPLILREPGSGIRDATLRVFQNADLKPLVRMELGSNEAIKHAIVGGLGLSVLSLHTLTLEGTDGPVAILDVEGFPVIRQWYLVHPRGKELSLVARTFLDFAIARAAPLRDRLERMWPALGPILDAAPEAGAPAVAKKRKAKS